LSRRCRISSWMRFWRSSFPSSNRPYSPLSLRTVRGVSKPARLPMS
jgi:hypothetical protein